MKGSETQLVSFLEGADKRFDIPVFQRKYDWKIENCQQLLNDLEALDPNLASDGQRATHFFGSIVAKSSGAGAKIIFQIIDGQQRITTVTLLLAAIANMALSGNAASQDQALHNEIMDRFLIAPWAQEDDKVKLHPVKGDREALEKILAGDKDGLVQGSNLTVNYRFFEEQIRRRGLGLRDLYAKVTMLQVVVITLDQHDDAQEIFESLNSTGLALTEGDKIRNYVLMDLDPAAQDRIFSQYWNSIEKCAGADVSWFVRDYLCVKQAKAPVKSRIYVTFKDYVASAGLRHKQDELLGDMLSYARIYQKLLSGSFGMPDVDDCIRRLNRLEINVMRPFFMEVVKKRQDGLLSGDDLARVFSMVESYIARRAICAIPTAGLNKIFAYLDREIERYGDGASYPERLAYALLSKKESARFPSDAEFKETLEQRQIYQMRPAYRTYLLERFENHGTRETSDVYRNLDDGVLTVEHVMPQTISRKWKESLGPDWEEIHEKWLHRLGNLTLTGYNSEMRNAPFKDKKECEHGFSSSHLHLNAWIAERENWGPAEMEERTNSMAEEAASEIWPLPKTTFTPEARQFDEFTLDDDETTLTGKGLAKYAYGDEEIEATSWANMVLQLARRFHMRDKSVLNGMVFGSANREAMPDRYFSTNPGDFRKAEEVADGIYMECNTSTTLKISILRALFKLYGADPSDLTIYVK